MKTGSGAQAPTTQTVYGPGGLVSQVKVFAAGANDTTPATSPAPQITSYFYDRLGQTDSVIGSGGRRQWFYSRDPWGVPARTYSGNGSFTASAQDWQGRVIASALSLVKPGVSFDGASHFADTYSQTQYNAAAGLDYSQHSQGQNYWYAFDGKGRAVEATHHEVNGDTLSIRRRGYSRTGQVIADTLTFHAAGMRIIRRYQYNRRGQRVLAADTVQRTAGGAVADAVGRISYFYDTRGRLDSMIGYDGSGNGTPYGRVRQLYGRGSRDSIRTVRLDPTAGGDSLRTTTLYDAAGRVSQIISQNGAGTTYANDGLLTYNKVDDLLSAYVSTPVAASVGMQYLYSSNGLRRLITEAQEQSGPYTSWQYDVFGNRVKELRSSPTNPSDTLLVDPGDNRLLARRNGLGGSFKQAHWYWHDRTGSRIGSTDTTGTVPTMESRMTYTAANQLAWSLTHDEPGSYTNLTYTATWHWYDAQGLREITEVAPTDITNYPGLGAGSGARTFYYYDGSDVALTLIKTVTDTFPRVAKRYLTGGLDRQLALRNYYIGYQGSLALITNRVGTTLGAMRANGTRETSVNSYTSNAFGAVSATDGTGGTNADVGFAGASTGDAKAGFAYMRNRWYDPQTGRFLTQDPIGLAGGVNLYAYAGNNPISFSDPFGLSPWGKLVSLGVRGLKTLVKGLDFDDMVRAAREGEDMIAPNRRVAREVAEAASDGRRPIGPEKSPGAGNRPHYHTADRNGSHIFYSVAAALTASHYADNSGPVVQGAAFLVDLVNPLSVLQDIVDVKEAIVDSDEAGDKEQKAAH